MKKITIFLIITFFLVTPSISSAHESVIDNSTEIELHIDPDDQPVALDPATIHFEITDKTSRFKLGNCSCTVTIQGENMKRFVSSLTPYKPGESVYDGYIPFVFPKKGKYTITLEATPLNGVEFTPFRADYDVPISKIDAKIESQVLFLKTFSYIIFSLLALGIVFLLVFLLKIMRANK